MGQITRGDIPKGLIAGLQTAFQQAYRRPETQWQKLATVVNSNKSEETYAWLGQAPAMREFGAERIPKGLSEFSYTIKNKKYENSIRVDRDALEDDQYGQIKIRVQEMADVAARLPEKLVFQLLSSGFATVCYDGQYFFDTDHSEGSSGTQSNKGTTALSATSYGVARAAMGGFKDDQGDTLGLIGDTLVVPLGLEVTARTMLNSDFVSDGTTTINNIWKNSASLIVSPYLTDANDWFLVATNGVVKPIILQDRTPVEFTALEADSENGFFRDAYHYGTRRRLNVGYGDWRTAYGAQVA
jgi:phage major head subunit gpT-like protein